MPFILKLLLGGIILTGVVSWICSDDPEFNRDYPPTTGNTVTVFLVDGLSDDIFLREMAAGRLPVLSQLVQTGTYVKNGICSFPTMTGYGYYPFITGRDATESGILGLRWFDRSRQEGNLRNYVGRTNVNMNSDITDSIENIFELSAPAYTASINTYMNRGVSHNVKTGWAHTTAKYEGKSIFRWLRALPVVGKSIAPDHFEHESAAMDIALRQLSKNPKVHWVTFPSPDAANHVFGTDTRYTGLLHHIDSLIGVYLRETQRLGQQNTRMIAVVSDHGVSDVHENLDFCSWFATETGLKTERGKSVNIFTSALDTPLSDLKDLDGYFVINGNLAGYLYMKNPGLSPENAWNGKLSNGLIESYPGPSGHVNIPEVMSANPQIELVIWRDSQDKLWLKNGRDKAEIRQDSTGKLIYRPVAGNPLQYPYSLHDVPMERFEWLDKTLGTQFPYAVVRIWQLISKPGIGDIVMTSRKGVDLAHDYEMFVSNYKGGHGGLRKEIISVPFVYTLPGEKPKIVNGMTNEDLGKLIMNHLNTGL